MQKPGQNEGSEKLRKAAIVLGEVLNTFID
jgi:hypothetical protein